MKKVMFVTAILFLSAVIIQACHTPTVHLQITNATDNCPTGACTILVTGTHDTPGPNVKGNTGPDKYGPVSVPPLTTSSKKAISSGNWHLTVKGSCASTTTFPETFSAGFDWTVTINCAAGAGAAEGSFGASNSQAQ